MVKLHHTFHTSNNEKKRSINDEEEGTKTHMLSICALLLTGANIWLPTPSALIVFSRIWTLKMAPVIPRCLKNQIFLNVAFE